MFERLLELLPEAALACRRLYNPVNGGYHLPPRAENRPLRLAEVARCRSEHPRVQYDCIELPVADLLYSLVVNTSSRTILETGTSRGFSTCHLAAGAVFAAESGDPAAGPARVITVDPAPTPHPLFGDSALRPVIEPICIDALSLALAPLLEGRPCDFMFFDSLHTYAHLSAELARFLPLLRLGGLFALHDTFVFDDLGLVVLALVRSGRVEMVSLPSHRRHAEPARSPGVSLFRKVAPIAAGELLFPDLDGILEGEQHCLSAPQRVLERTGSLFTDARYHASTLREAPARQPLDPALLDPRDPGASTVRATAAAAVPQGRLERLPPELLARELAWWSRYGPLNEGFVWTVPAALESPAQRRCLARIAAHFAGCARVAVLGHGAAVLAERLRALGGFAEVQVARCHDEPLPNADGYLFHGALHHLAGDALDGLPARLRRAAAPGTPVLALEPVCFPGQSPRPEDRALFERIDELLALPAATARRAGVAESPRAAALRAELLERWWGRPPFGPSPSAKPFEHGELVARLSSGLAVRDQGVVQCVKASAQLSTELALLAVDAPALAAQLAADLHPRMEALERALLSADRLPDSSWYLLFVQAELPR